MDKPKIDSSVSDSQIDNGARNGVLMTETAHANRARHFELVFTQFTHRIEKLERVKSVPFFLSSYGTIKCLSKFTRYFVLFLVLALLYKAKRKGEAGYTREKFLSRYRW